MKEKTIKQLEEEVKKLELEKRKLELKKEIERLKNPVYATFSWTSGSDNTTPPFTVSSK